MTVMIYEFFALLLAFFFAIKTSSGGAISHVGVSKADVTDFPYVAAILDDDLDEFLGMGVIVSKNVIFCEEIVVEVEEIRVRVGSALWSSGGIVLKAKEIIDYHYYNLIILAEDLQFTNAIQPITLSDDATQMQPGVSVNVVGWGHKAPKAPKVASELLMMPTKTLSDATCQHAYEDIFDEVPDGIPIFCLEHPKGHGVFDEAESLAVSGGFLQGFGVYREETEEMEHPALFVHVSIFIKKIRKTIRKYETK